MRQNTIAFLSWIANTLVTVTATLAASTNVLVIVSDDQGYGDAGFQGSSEIVTPNLDRLAASGVRCTNGYVSHPFCSPTRAGLLTGRYQQRFGHEYNPVYDPLDEREGLPLTERLWPQWMQDGGYDTAWIGKWHLGSSPSHSPWNRGFAHCYGFIGGGHRFMDWQPNERQYTLPLVRNGQPLDEVPAHLTTEFGDEVARFIRAHTEKPWCLYLAFNAPHVPHEPTEERLAKFAHISNVRRRRYAAQVSLMDDAIGTAIQALADTDQTNRTLVFFFSDNGGHEPSGSDNGPLRGIKGDVYEGGVRVPYIVSWPGRLPAGATYDPPVCSLDVMATSLAAAGVAMPRDGVYDGVDLIPYLTGTVTTRPHQRLYWRMQHKQTLAMRDGDWKLVRLPDQPQQLYDLANDLGESHDLANERPRLLATLSAALDKWNAELVAPAFPGSTVKSEDWGPGGANQQNRK
ncbi:MAG: sulfatase-like hydrolase/transferase [Pirellulaceae bacterium]|nr:sulfatase-like hydrolase/transferase [Planctomycetales bacterium]